VEYSGLGAKALKGILDIGTRLETAEFTTMISPVILRLFASNDRSIRAALCENLPLYIDKLSEADINQTIFNNISSGFNDTNPIIREHTLKAVTLLAPKLNTKTVNNQLLRHLAKLQTDPEPGIRTNTIISLFKIAPYLNESVTIL
jgi:SCY1-like protein 1